MKNLWKIIGSFVKFAFAVGVVLFVASLSYSFAQKVYPTAPLQQGMLLILFDVAAFVWFTTFMVVADGTLQRAIAGVMFFISLLAILLIVAAETITGSAAEMAGITVENLQGYATWAIVVLAFLNATASYSFYLTSPKNLKKMQEAYATERQREHESKMVDLQLDIKEDVMKETELAMKDEARQAGRSIANSLMKREMQTFYATLGVKKTGNGEFILDSEWSDPAQTTTPRTLPGGPIHPPTNSTPTGNHRHTRTDSKSGWKIPGFISKKILTTFVCPHCQQEAVMSNLGNGTMKCNTCQGIVALAPSNAPTGQPTNGNGNGHDPNAPTP